VTNLQCSFRERIHFGTRLRKAPAPHRLASYPWWITLLSFQGQKTRGAVIMKFSRSYRLEPSFPDDCLVPLLDYPSQKHWLTGARDSFKQKHFFIAACPCACTCVTHCCITLPPHITTHTHTHTLTLTLAYAYAAHSLKHFNNKTSLRLKTRNTFLYLHK
jgi:hypothetical protein